MKRLQELFASQMQELADESDADESEEEEVEEDETVEEATANDNEILEEQGPDRELGVSLIELSVFAKFPGYDGR